MAIDKHASDLAKDPARIKFLCSINNDEYESVMSYNDIMSCISDDEDESRVWKFKKIISHQGPLKNTDPLYKGSKFNVLIEWENGETTLKPLSIIAVDDPVTCAIYAKENNLLEKDRRCRFKGIAKRHKKFVRLVNQAKIRSYKYAPRYKYGYEVPRNRDYSHAKELDRQNGNRKWQDSIDLERKQLQEYSTFKDKGVGVDPSKGYKKIRVHIVFDLKHNGRHKACFVAGRHLTPIPLESVYSGVISLRGVRLLIFLVELNGLDLWTTDIGNAYLEAFTKESVYIIAGPEFGEVEVHTLIIVKALSGLQSSGLRWHERLVGCLREMDFTPCRGLNDVWMKRIGNHYEYIGVYVDDLMIVSKKPKV